MLATLERLPGLAYVCFAPGHGPAYHAGEEFAAICAANREQLEEIRALVYSALERPQETGTLLRHVADHFGLRLEAAALYLLTQTSILAALSSLERAGRVKTAVEDNRLLWQRI
jgi:hypothetical protein